jgi:hypothetical protein
MGDRGAIVADADVPAHRQPEVIGPGHRRRGEHHADAHFPAQHRAGGGRGGGEEVLVELVDVPRQEVGGRGQDQAAVDELGAEVATGPMAELELRLRDRVGGPGQDEQARIDAGVVPHARAGGLARAEVPLPDQLAQGRIGGAGEERGAAG